MTSFAKTITKRLCTLSFEKRAEKDTTLGF